MDAYPEYTGTALTSFFKRKATDVPHDEQKAYEEAKAEFAKSNLTALPPTPFTDSNGVGMAKANAAKLGITKISDLKDKASKLTFYGTPECPQRPDCLLGLKDVYGLKFKKVVAVDPSLRHKVLDGGQADVSIVYTTDGQIAQGKETLLQDDKHMFPPYNVTLVFDQAKLSALGPDAAEDDRARPEGPHHRGDAGAELAGRHRQADAREGRQGLPHGVRVPREIGSGAPP